MEDKGVAWGLCNLKSFLECLAEWQKVDTIFLLMISIMKLPPGSFRPKEVVRRKKIYGKRHELSTFPCWAHRSNLVKEIDVEAAP